jgi:hypothetical protein
VTDSQKTQTRRCGAIGYTTIWDSHPGAFGHDHGCDLGPDHDGHHVCFKCRTPFTAGYPSEPLRRPLGTLR